MCENGKIIFDLTYGKCWEYPRIFGKYPNYLYIDPTSFSLLSQYINKNYLVTDFRYLVPTKFMGCIVVIVKEDNFIRFGG